MGSDTDCPAKHDCQRILSERRFEALTAQIGGLPSRIDRRIVFTAIRDGLFARRGYKLLDPEWCRKRDKVVDELRQAIQALRVVLETSPWAKFSGTTKDETGKTWVDYRVGGLEREYAVLMESKFEGHKPFMKLSREVLGWQTTTGRGGRPPETWKSETISRLREAGLSQEAARALVREVFSA